MILRSPLSLILLIINRESSKFTEDTKLIPSTILLTDLYHQTVVVIILQSLYVIKPIFCYLTKREQLWRHRKNDIYIFIIRIYTPYPF